MPQVQHGNPGKTLAAHREALGWTVEQVADQLKLAVRQVVALEADDYASLPSPAVTRGFIRAYAKILKIDAAPLVAQVEMESPAAAETTTVRRAQPARFNETSRFPMHSKRSSLPIGWIAAGVVIVAAGAAAWHFGLFSQHGGDLAAPAASHSSELPPPASATGSASEPLQNPNVPLISVPTPNTGAAPASAPGTNPQGANTPAAAPAAGEAAPANAAPAPANSNVVVYGAPGQPAAPAPAPVAAAPAQAQSAARPVQAATATAVGQNALVFDVREDAWIQVKTASGKTLLSRLVKGGSTETVQVDEPATMIVGNAGAVSATLRGAPVQLPLLPGKTVSRVTIK